MGLACAAFVVWLWRRPLALEYKANGLVVASLLATPYSYHYDFALMGLALLALCWLAPLAMPEAAARGLPLGPFLLAALLAVLLRRALPPAAAFAAEPMPAASPP